MTELLAPLIEKAMRVKGYSRQLAAEKAFVWIAQQIGVSPANLSNLTYEQQWCAEAAVERAMLPAPKKHKKRFAPPVIPSQPRYDPLPTEFWLTLQREWGTEFYARFFGDWTAVKVEGTISPGQYAIEEIRKANTSALIDA